MTTFLTVVALIGLIVFAVAAIAHLVTARTTAGPGFATRPPAWWTFAVIGLIVWAVATIILMLIALF